MTEQLQSSDQALGFHTFHACFHQFSFNKWIPLDPGFRES